MLTRSSALTLASLLFSVVPACDGPSRDRKQVGDSDFESASQSGQSPSAEPPKDTAGADEDGAGGERAVEEADIYRFVDDRLYVLNQFRGLYVFDVADPDKPVELGRLPLEGYPVDMYVRGDRAYVIVSDYFSYWRTEDSLAEGIRPVFGSRIVGVDLSDPGAPATLGEVILDGYVSDTRLVGDVIYAVANRWAWWGALEAGVPADETKDEVVVVSIDLADPTSMREVQREEFEGQGYFVHATPDAFAVAGTQWEAMTGAVSTQVSLLDISSPTGEMVRRGQASVAGGIQEDTALDLRDGQLRLLTRDWADQTTHLTILDTSRPDELPVLGGLDYTYTGGLFGTTFDGDRLYMIHYQTHDPLDVVDLSDPTHPIVAGILEMPGWVDRIAALGDRLVGLGVDDTDGRKISVSLFDVAVAAEPKLLARISSGSSWSWSSASWERKAWTVDAEAGLILFPYSGWDEASARYQNALGILEFDRDTLTARGEVDAPAPVERGAVQNDRVYAISQATLQVIDLRDRDNPIAAPTVELARNVYDYARTASVGVELFQTGFDWWSSGAGSALRVTPLDRPDGPVELGRLAVPRPAQALLSYGDLAVAIQSWDACGGWAVDGGATEPGGKGGGTCDATRPGVTVCSVADAAHPTIVADLELPAVPVSTDPSVSTWSYWQGRYGTPMGGWQGGAAALDLGGGRFGLIRTTSTSCWGTDDEVCRAAGIEPTGYDGGDGHIYYSGYRSDSALAVLDLSDASNPRVLGPFELSGGAEGAFVADGTLVYSYAEASRTDAGGLSWARYYMGRMTIDADGAADSLPGINVPGVVVALRDGGTTALSLDPQWVTVDGGGSVLELWMNALKIEDDSAVRVAKLKLGAQLATFAVVGDRAYAVEGGYWGVVGRDGGAGVSTSPAGASPVESGSSPSDGPTLSVIDVSDPESLAVVSTQSLGDSWWSIALATSTDLVLSGGYYGGLALFDLGDPDHPAFQEFVRTQGWASSMLEDSGVLYVVAGPYGVTAVGL